MLLCIVYQHVIGFHHSTHTEKQRQVFVQAAANELVAAEAERSKLQSSLNEVYFSRCFVHSHQQCRHTGPLLALL